jgi:dihydroorotate dehydrogenase (NAD+) catalytic subunit
VLQTTLGRLRLDNPVLSASGTFGSGHEGRQFSDLGRVGGLVSKTVTLKPRPGNPPPRIHETPSGMLNSIGLGDRAAS